MRVKVDEDLPRSLAALLQQRGHDVATVRDQGLSGCTDDALWPVVQSEERFLVTADKGFADARTHAPGTHPGVLLLRPDEDGVPAVVALLTAVLKETDLSALARSIAVASPRGLRIRRVP